MLTVQYVFLHSLLLLIIYIYGLKIATLKSIKRYWHIAWIPIIAFTVEEGFRWGRHIDWCAYYYQYQYMLDGFKTTHEPFFRFIWGIFAFFDLPYPIVIAFCSFLLVFSLFYFFKPYNKLAYILLVFLIVWIAPKAMNLIRWYMGISFLLIAFRFYLNGKKLISYVWFFFSFFTHYAMLPLIVLIFFVSSWKRRFCKPWVLIIISISLILFFNTSFMAHFVPLVENLSEIERFSGYAMNAEGWLTGDLQNATIEKKSALIYILTSLPFYFYIVYGYNETKEEIMFYNLAIIGISLRSISSGLELLGRYSASLDPFLIFMATNSIITLNYKTHKTLINRIILIIIYLSLIVQIFRFCAPMERVEYMHYIWNYQIQPSRIYDLYMSD